MSSSIKQGLLKRQSLDSTELSEIKQLAQLCNQREGLDIRMNWKTLQRRPANQFNDFLYYVDGQIVGFLALFSFNSHEGEISGMVHPDYRRRGIFSTLLDAVQQEGVRRGIASLLLIVEHISSAGQAFAHHLPTTSDHSEYKMVLEKPRLPAVPNEHLQFRAAQFQDTPAMSFITAQAFDMPLDDVSWYTEQALSQPDRRYYLGEVDGVIVGKLDVNISEEAALILGFAVLPEYQGRGYGRHILAHTIQELLNDNQQRAIWLEVNAVNRQALSLYQSCGFKEVGSYDYYRLALETSA